MSGGFHFWHSQPLDRVTPPWLENPHPPAMSHPRRPRGSHSGREKRRDESFQVRAKEPLGTYSHRTVSKNSSRCWLPHANQIRHLSHWFISGKIKGEGWGEKNDPKAKRREWPPGKRCNEHMEVMQARLTALELNDWPLTTPSLLFVICVKYT